MGIRERIRRLRPATDAIPELTLSRFGAFGPGSGLVVALVGLASEAPREDWRRFADRWLTTFRERMDIVNTALDTIQDARADPMASTFYFQAKRWASEELEIRVAALPDEWFDNFVLYGQPGVPSGVKRACIDRLALAAVGLAAMAFGPQEAAAEAFSDAAWLVPLDDILLRSVVTTHARIIDPFAGLGPDLKRVPEA